MPSVRTDWSALDGLTLQTATGATFNVVRVTAAYVTVRPQNGRHDYALSIARELEPAVAVFSEAKTLPIPADLRALGVRPILTSYAWGVLKAVVVDRIGLLVVHHGMSRIRRRLADHRHVRDGLEYLEEGESEPVITLEVPPLAGVSGEFAIDLYSGSINGDLRDFGGEQIVVFGYEGMDEMDPVRWRLDAVDKSDTGRRVHQRAWPFSRRSGSGLRQKTKRLPQSPSRAPKRGGPGRGVRLFSERR